MTGSLLLTQQQVGIVGSKHMMIDEYRMITSIPPVLRRKKRWVIVLRMGDAAKITTCWLRNKKI